MSRGKLYINYSKFNISSALLIYWIVLVIWQNLTGSENRSGADLYLKFALIIFLTAFYFSKAKSLSRNIFVILIFALELIVVFWLSGDKPSPRNLIMYFFPILFAFLSFGIGDDFQITKKELISFLHGVILVVTYMALYSVFFRTSHFKSILSLNIIYGNELSSFLISNHEYAMYLVYAIIGCVVCLEIRNDCQPRTKIKYYLAIILFLPNLLLTFSRTAMLAAGVFLLVYCFVRSNTKTKKWMIFAAVVMAIVIASSAKMRDFVDLVIFKGVEGRGSRSELYDLFVQIFQESTTLEKLFGHGIEIRDLFAISSGHGSVHNAYLQVLLYGGVTCFVFFIIFLIVQLVENIKLYRFSGFYAMLFSSLVLSAMAFMLTNTAIVFNSPIDSFFLTVVGILIPKYVRNSIKAGTFERI